MIGRSLNADLRKMKGTSVILAHLLIPNMIAVNRIEHRHKTSSINSFDKNAAGLSGKDNRF